MTPLRIEPANFLVLYLIQWLAETVHSLECILHNYWEAENPRYYRSGTAISEPCKSKSNRSLKPIGLWDFEDATFSEQMVNRWRCGEALGLTCWPRFTLQEEPNDRHYLHLSVCIKYGFLFIKIICYEQTVTEFKVLSVDEKDWDLCN
jgi:hypothetical protein